MRDFLIGLQRNLLLTQGCFVIPVNYLELNEALLMKSADDFKTAEGHLGPLNNTCFNPPTQQIPVHQSRGCYLCIGQKYKAWFWAGCEGGECYIFKSSESDES